MPHEFTITPINCGLLHGVERSNLTLKAHVGEKTAVPTIMWVIQGGGEVIVADTGCGDPHLVADRFGRKLEQEETPVRALRSLGIDPKDVSMVVATHLHWDHAGDLDMFPNAEIYVHRKELHWAIAPSPIQNDIYELHRHHKELPRWIYSLRRMRAVDRDVELMPGLKLVHLPGHTPGIMGVAANTRVGTYLVAGDAVPTYENWEEGIAPGWYVDIRDCDETFGKMKDLTDKILPGHDMKVFEHARYPFGA